MLDGSREVCGEAGDSKNAIEMARAALVLLDIYMLKMASASVPLAVAKPHLRPGSS